MSDREDFETFLLLISPLWLIMLTLCFTMLFHDFRAGGTLAIMIQGLFFIKISREDFYA